MAKTKKSKYVVDVPDMSIVKRTHKNHSHLVWSALHYCQYEMAEKALKKDLLAYAKKAGLDYKTLNLLTDGELAMLGKYAHIINGGGELPEDTEVSFKNCLEEKLVMAVTRKKASRAVAKKQETKPVAPVLTVQDRMREQAEIVAAQFDQWIDDVMFGKVKSITKAMDPAAQLTIADFKAGQARWIKTYYEPELEEIKAVIAGNDEQVKEGYSNIQKSAALRVQKLLETIITAAEMIETVSKAQRKTRTKKAPSLEKRIAKLKYCERNDAAGVASVNPIGIIGASEVWVYNTKYRKLGKYVAQDAAGLSVKGTSITNFSDAESREKKLRKPETQLKEFMGSGKVKLRTFLDSIKAVDTKMKGRLNEHTVILKVVK